MNSLPNVSRETAYEMCLKLDALSVVYQDILPAKVFKEVIELVNRAKAELFVSQITKPPSLSEVDLLDFVKNTPTTGRYINDTPENLV